MFAYILRIDGADPTKENDYEPRKKAYIVQLVKQIVHPYFAGEIADILIAHGMTFKTEPQTNADRIRAMSDEDLAWELMTWRIDTVAKCSGDESNYPSTQATILEWLRQPAEVET